MEMLPTFNGLKAYNVLSKVCENNGGRLWKSGVFEKCTFCIITSKVDGLVAAEKKLLFLCILIFVQFRITLIINIIFKLLFFQHIQKQKWNFHLFITYSLKKRNIVFFVCFIFLQTRRPMFYHRSNEVKFQSTGKISEQ